MVGALQSPCIKLAQEVLGEGQLCESTPVTFGNFRYEVQLLDVDIVSREAFANIVNNTFKTIRWMILIQENDVILAFAFLRGLIAESKESIVVFFWTLSSS